MTAASDELSSLGSTFLQLKLTIRSPANEQETVVMGSSFLLLSLSFAWLLGSLFVLFVSLVAGFGVGFKSCLVFFLSISFLSSSLGLLCLCVSLFHLSRSSLLIAVHVFSPSLACGLCFQFLAKMKQAQTLTGLLSPSLSPSLCACVS